tara:strand:- start:197 stop:559 length:363 start_codon:yes stop_codon:yes gene_type:complete
MFADPTATEAFQLVAKDGWRDQIETCSEEVAALIGRLLVEEVVGDPIELVSRALDAVIGRWNTELRYDVNDIDQLRKHQPIVQWLAQRQEEMHQEETRPAAVDAVVDWLRNQEREEQADS